MSATAWKRAQLASTLIWIGLIWPSITVWRTSLPYLVFISVDPKTQLNMQEAIT